jgi:hypothetical protein
MRRFVFHVLIAALILPVLSVWGQTQTNPFALATPYTTGYSPTGIASTDFNFDGVPDIVVANSCGNTSQCNAGGTASVFLGNGDGTFQTGVQYATGANSPFVVVTGDFNNDESPDIAILNFGSNSSVALLTGNGDGTFNAPTLTLLNDSASDMAVGDLNGDGNLDLVIGAANGLYLLTGNGAGTFTVSKIAPPPINCAFNSVALSSLRNNGALDVVAGASCSSSTFPNLAQILLNSGTGTFTLQTTVSFSFPVTATVVGDTNFDGIPDLVVGSTNSSNFYVGLGDGKGNFPSFNTYAAGDGFFAIPAAITPPVQNTANAGTLGRRVMRTRGQGAKMPPPQLGPSGEDVVILGGYGFNVLINTGTDNSNNLPAFYQPVSYGIATDGPFQPANPYAAMADFNGDGAPDIAVVDFIGNQVWVSLGQPNATYTPAGQGFQASIDTPVTSGGTGSLGWVTALNLGGLNPPPPGQGIAVANTVTNTVDVFSSLYANPVSFSVGTAPTGIVTGNFSGSGYSDLATANFLDDTISVLLYTGGPAGLTFAPAVTYSVGKAPAFIATGDVNGDGILDLVTANEGDNTISVLFGNGGSSGIGNGTFQGALSFPVGVLSSNLVAGTNARSVAVADLNGDGYQDVVTANAGDNTISVLLATVSFIGGGTGFGFTRTDYPVGNQPAAVVIADFNNDFIPDIAVYNAGDLNVNILLGKADGTFGPPTVVQLPTANSASVGIVAQDFNGDTNTDLAVPNLSGSILYLQGNGDGSFQAPVFVVSPHQPTVIATGDFNGDGIPDLAVANFDEPVVTAILNATTAQQVAPPVCQGITPAKVIGTQLTANLQCRGNFFQGNETQHLGVNLVDTQTNLTAGCNGTQCGMTGNIITFFPSFCLPTGGATGITLQETITTASGTESQGSAQSQPAINAIAFAVTPPTANVQTNGFLTFNTPEPNACLTWSLSAPELSVTADPVNGKTDAVYLAPSSVPSPNTVNVQAQYADGTPATPATVTITSPQVAPSFTSAASATFQTGVASSFTVTTTGLPTPSIVENGALPDGVKFVDNGNGTATLSGTPSQLTGGSFPLTFTAQNGVLPNAIQNFTLTVSSANSSPAITSANQTTFNVGVAGSFTVTTTGKPTPSITGTGALPSGVTFNDNGNGTATLSGTPAAGTGGVYAITFTAQNGIAPNATQNFSLTIPTITLTYPASPNLAATQAGGAAIQFTALVTGIQNSAVLWTLSGSGCGGNPCGTLDQQGLYTPPATLPESSLIMDTVSVASTGDTALPVLSVAVTVYPPPVVSQPPPPVSVPAGQTATTSLQVTGNTGTVMLNFACRPQQFAQGANCTVTPLQSQLTSSPLGLTVQITTTSQLAAAASNNSAGRRGPILLAMFAPVVGIVLAGSKWRRRKLWQIVGIAVILVVPALLVSCGTNGTFGALPPSSALNATPSGVYQIQIVAAPPGVDPQSSGASSIAAITVTVNNTH